MSAFFMDLLQHMVDRDASDIYLTQGITPMFRIEGKVLPYGEQRPVRRRYPGHCRRDHERQAEEDLRREA